jgi:hypothetical protein
MAIIEKVETGVKKAGSNIGKTAKRVAATDKKV